jgi:hypothetical protein
MVWNQLPPEIWNLVGEYIFSDVNRRPDGNIEVVLKPARFYSLHFEEGLTFITPAECLLT